MQALVYTAVREVELQDQPIPQPKAGEVLLRVEASGVCGSDVDGFLGRSRKRKPPLVMGHEFTGRLMEDNQRLGLKAGDSVAVLPLLGCLKCTYCQAGKTNLCPDRRLIGMDIPGAFADYVIAPEWSLYALPAGVTPKAATMAEPMANGIHIRKLVASDRPVPESAFILGAGTIGMVAIAALMDAGCKNIVVSDTNPARLQVATRIGASATVDAKSGNVTQQVQDTLGHVPLVVDCIGLAATRALAIDVADISALIVQIGLHDGEMAGEARDIVTKELTIKGSYGYNAGDFQDALNLIARQNTLFESLVTYEPLGKGQSVFEKLVSDPEALIKVALTP